MILIRAGLDWSAITFRCCARYIIVAKNCSLISDFYVTKWIILLCFVYESYLLQRGKEETEIHLQNVGKERRRNSFGHYYPRALFAFIKQFIKRVAKLRLIVPKLRNCLSLQSPVRREQKSCHVTLSLATGRIRSIRTNNQKYQLKRLVGRKVKRAQYRKAMKGMWEPFQS